jgi:hypothetical protein
MDRAVIDCHLRRRPAAVIDRIGSSKAAVAADAEEPDWSTVAHIPPGELLEHRDCVERTDRLANILDDIWHPEIWERSSAIAFLGV